MRYKCKRPWEYDGEDPHKIHRRERIFNIFDDSSSGHTRTGETKTNTGEACEEMASSNKSQSNERLDPCSLDELFVQESISSTNKYKSQRGAIKYFDDNKHMTKELVDRIIAGIDSGPAKDMDHHVYSIKTSKILLCSQLKQMLAAALSRSSLVVPMLISHKVSNMCGHW